MWLAIALTAYVASAMQGEEISCKWLLTAMGSALVGTNAFWAMWVKTLISENKTLNAERTQDLKDMIKSAKD